MLKFTLHLFAFKLYKQEEYYFVSLYDGTCDQTKELKKLSGTMPNDEKWVISSSGHHMFVGFNVDWRNSRPGFTAKIHYGNEINVIEIYASKHMKT